MPSLIRSYTIKNVTNFQKVYTINPGQWNKTEYLIMH